MKIFVSGIHTDIGKTVVSTVLVRALSADYWKPVQAGSPENTDADVVRRYNKNAKIFPAQYQLKKAASPHFAASEDGVNIGINDFIFPPSKRLIMEGAGGLLSPLGNNFTNLDFIKHYQLKCILVVKHYLGSISHTLSCLELIKKENIDFSGIIYVGKNLNQTEEFIDHYTRAKVLGRIAWADKIDEEFVEEMGRNLRIGND
jgi:dethiobiotin synthetase